MARYTAVTCLLLALVAAASSARFFRYRSCRCQLEPSLYANGRLFGTSCYVSGHGYCARFSFAPRHRFRGGRLGAGGLSVAGRFGGNSLDSQFGAVGGRQAVAAAEAARRSAALEVTGRFATVRPNSPSAALAQEKRADDRSLALGYQALQQIYFLQNLLASGRR